MAGEWGPLGVGDPQPGQPSVGDHPLARVPFIKDDACREGRAATDESGSSPARTCQFRGTGAAARPVQPV